jgi:hypothetical protein
MQIDLTLPPAARGLFTATLQRIAAERVVERVWARDASVWHPSAATQARIRERLGWLDLPRDPRGDPALQRWLAQLPGSCDALFVAPGAAQSSIRLWRDLAAAPERRLALLDTIDPAAAQATLSALDWSRTALVLAATELTPELESLASLALAERPPAAAPVTLITAAESDVAQRYRSMARVAEQAQLIDVPADLGERFGTLSALGLTAAALAGYDLDRLVSAALLMRAACQQSSDLHQNPGALLGALLGALAQHGRDKLTVLAPPALAPLSDWIASFVAASLGKHGRGFVPISAEPWIAPAGYRTDRGFVALRLAEAPNAALDQQIGALREAGQAVVVLTLPDRADVAAHVLCWQVAVAVAASIIGVNPFDEPDTAAMRAFIARRVRDPQPMPDVLPDATDLVESARAALPLLRRANWVALASYLPPSDEQEDALAALRRLLLRRAGLSTVVVHPLRDHAYSVQLLHAGRSDGVVLALLPRSSSAPNEEIVASLHTLCRTRMAVELGAWRRMGRTAIAVELDGAAGLRAFGAELDRLL